MPELLEQLFFERGLPPHGYCLLWSPTLIWANVLADAAIGLSYFSIPVVIATFLKRRRDVQFSWAVWMFAAFILACGATHFISIATLWVPAYGIEALVKILTATASVITAVALWPLLPRVIALPSPLQLQRVNETLRTRVAERDEALGALRRETAERERAEEVLRLDVALIDRKNRQLRQSERMAAIGSWRFDLSTQAIEWSDQVYAIHGLPVTEHPDLEEALGFYPAHNREEISRMIDRAVEFGEPYEFESDFITATGDLRRVRGMGELELEDGKPAALIGVFQDVTDRYRQEVELRRIANTDVLTGLPNRKMFQERLEALTATNHQNSNPFAVLLIDLDGFKSINDTYGHGIGDDVLRTVAHRLRGPNCMNAFAARLGGDEFVMLVSRPRDCAELPTFVRAVLQELRYLIERDETRIEGTATIGAALCDESRFGGDVLRHADLALYAAKRAERGSGRIFGSDEKLLPRTSGVSSLSQRD